MREQPPVGKPRVKHHSRVRRATIPYEVHVDAQKVAEVLRRERVDERDIKNLVIVVKDDDPGEAASFEYRNKSRRITLYGHDAWGKYVEARDIVIDLISGKQNPSNQFAGLLYTKRLPGYVIYAPKERGVRFAEKVLRNAVCDELNSDLLHELRHMIDHARGKYAFWFAIEGRIMDFLEPVIDKFDPSERSASAFEKKVGDNPLYRNLVSVKPRRTK